MIKQATSQTTLELEHCFY